MIAEASSMVRAIVPKHGGDDIRFAADAEESAAIWRGRKVRQISFRRVSRILRCLVLPLILSNLPPRRSPTGVSWL